MLTTTAGGALDYAFQITPQTLGDRTNTVSTIYSRYKVNSLKFMLRSKRPFTDAGTVVYGCIDDVQSAFLTTTTPAQVLDFRTSGEGHVYSNLTLNWRPLDKSKVYYTQNTGDSRFAVPCTYLVTTDDTLGNSVALFALDVHYSITFEGATTASFSVEDPETVILAQRDYVPSTPPLRTPFSGYSSANPLGRK